MTAIQEPSALQFDCETDYYLNIADQILAKPEGVIPKESADRELFTLLSDFYLNADKPKVNAEEELELMMV